jgi:hypothetical protein
MRLELALARELYLQLATPKDQRRQLMASQQGKTWERFRIGGWMVNENGTPNREYVSVLEKFVAAVERACQPQYQEVFIFLSKNYPAGEESLKRLVRAGANPVWIVEHCLELRPLSLPGNRPPTEDPRPRKHVITRLKRLARKFDTLADDYSTLLSAGRDVGFTGVRDEPTAFLRKQSQSLDQIAKSMTARRPSSERSKALELAEHLVWTTGTYKDHEVCRLLDAVQPRRNDRYWTIGALEQFRFRQREVKGIPTGVPLFNSVAEIVDAEIKRRRATINS